MRYPRRILCPAMLLATLAGCASSPPATVAALPASAGIAVSCTEDAISDRPCFAEAQHRCAKPAVDTIHLVLAEPGAGTPRYDYRATYSCASPVNAVAPK
ncbi:hypothetical protein FIV34_20690 [Luteibacter pinisoli]|uniref:Lipoprotein n=1 Tax=Luteibacter pinisoli TaxID=2589080 RepID=A0A4Y5ZBF2_9GAMM|nr:hypothetical protein [Luteibacter pinisoli]QDE41443.1 hypothetical protein FIV34_20690 [Luteibacter pinisoli]